MKLIIGGAYQGKLTYAVKKYSLDSKDIFDFAGGYPEGQYACYTHFEQLTRRAALSRQPFGNFIDDFPGMAFNSIVISREIGCGVVPMDADERFWREYHGMALSALARNAESVTRIFCGIPEVLK